MHRGDRWVLVTLALLLCCGGLSCPAERSAIPIHRSTDSLEIALLSAWRTGETTLDLPSPMPLDIVSSQYFSLLNANPELFAVACRFTFTAGDAGVLSLGIEYLGRPEERELLFADFDAALENILQSLPPRVSDYAAARILHDALAAVACYGANPASPLGREGAYTAYGALVDGHAVCRGYAMAYLTLLRRVGIEAEYVTSEEMGHGWVQAVLDGRRLHIDVTWDDNGSLSHRCFARDSEAMVSLGYSGWT